MRCSIGKALSGPIVQPLLNEIDMLVSQLLKTRFLGEILPYQAVGVFVGPTLP